MKNLMETRLANNTLFTERQLAVHGEIILAYLRDKNIAIQFKQGRSSRWKLLNNSSRKLFIVQYEYRLAEVLYKFEDGTVIYKDQEIFWFDCTDGKVHSTFADSDMSFIGNSITTRVFTKRDDAGLAGKRMLVEVFNKQFVEVQMSPEKRFSKLIEDSQKLAQDFPGISVTIDQNF